MLSAIKICDTLTEKKKLWLRNTQIDLNSFMISTEVSDFTTIW